jgi:hypothetical protein
MNATALDFNDRLTVFLPLSNPLGFYNFVREENGEDPNRDFPYDQPSNTCLRTVAARAIHRLFYHYRGFQIGIAFHGGDESITFPWGSYTNLGEIAPDDTTLKSIAENLKQIAGGDTYKTGTMNDIVYPVHGGMEDWSYSLGIKSELSCVGDYGNYVKNYTENISLPSGSIFLVESTKIKTPPEETLGSSEELWETDTRAALSPVPRCIRMILAVAEAVSPRATFLPISLKSSIPVLLEGCITAVIMASNKCESSSVESALEGQYSCASRILFLPLPQFVATDCKTELQIEFDRSLIVPRGVLDFATGRSSSISGRTEPAACVLIDSRFPVCVSNSTLIIHPFLVHHRAAISLYSLTDDSLISRIENVTSVVSDISLELPVELILVELEFKSSTDTGFVFRSRLSSDELGGEMKSEPASQLWLLLLLLLIPAGLIFYLLRRKKHRYLTVSADSPRSDISP